MMLNFGLALYSKRIIVMLWRNDVQKECAVILCAGTRLRPRKQSEGEIFEFHTRREKYLICPSLYPIVGIHA